MKSSKSARKRNQGFTLAELMVVMAIIAMIAAVSLPNLVAFFRANRIRASHDLLSTALQKARNTAIARNTQMGVSFITQNATTFWVHIEDTIAGVTTGDAGFTRQAIDFASPNLILSSRYQLPVGVEFAADAADCPDVAGFTPANASLRFDRSGLSTVPPSTGTTAIVLAGGSTVANFVYAPVTGDRVVCLVDRQTNLRRRVEISPGGRIVRR